MLLLPLICSTQRLTGGCFFVGLLLGSCHKGGVLFCLVKICFRGIGGVCFCWVWPGLGWCAGVLGMQVGDRLDLAWIWIGYGLDMGGVWIRIWIEKVVGKSREIIKNLP